MQISPNSLTKNSPSQDNLLKKLLANPHLIEAEQRRRANQFRTLFPDEGVLRRELYPKHLEFFKAGDTYKERLFMAANRVGKSLSGAYETVCHLTGQYPGWWQGRRFNIPVDGWACGTNGETTRNIVQGKLLGPVDPTGAFIAGTGMIPGELIVHHTPRRGGLAGAVETVWVRHISGKNSRVAFKSYEQGRKSFEGDAKHFVWMDEEPDEDIYTEALYRTPTVKGIIYTTFTPLQGMSNVVKGFIEPETDASAAVKFYVQAGWKDVPHLDEEEKRVLLAGTPAYQRKARTDGEPSLGAGAIYPIAEEEISCEWFEIPKNWPRAFAMDVGWKRTAALWGARDPATGIITVYSEHYQGQAEPVVHAQAIKSRGAWIKGVIDPACLGSSQIDGRTLMELYTGLGLKLEPAVNAVEAGIQEVWGMLSSGRLKVMKTCQNFFREFRKYHRDAKGSGKIVKADDHLCDSLRYLVVSGQIVMSVEPKPQSSASVQNFGRPGGWQK